MPRWIGFLVLVLVCARICNAQAPNKEQLIFEIHNGFWLNLHQFLYQQATASTATQSDSPAWQAALEYYRREIVPHDEMSNALIEVNDRLSAAGSASELPTTGLDAELVTTLVKAAPFYRLTWWPQHNRANQEWIDAVLPLIAKYGAAIQKDIVAVYGVNWPTAPIRADVSVYCGPFGAYTTVAAAPHITISSVDPSYQGNASLEMLFHESSHALDEKIRAALTKELTTRGKLFSRRGFDHAIIFYTAGEITRRYLAGYEPYAIKNGIWENGWPGGLAVLEKDWEPFLEGRTDMAAAVQAIVADYGVPRNIPQ